MIRRVFIVVLFCLAALVAIAQQVTIVGDIVSENTGEPIPNASIFFQGTSIGTSSNNDGAFLLRADITRKRILVVSAIGYYSQRFQVEPGAMAGIQVALKEKTATLEEVYVRPGENPALPLIAAVKEHRKDNDRFLQSDLSADVNTQTDLYISDLDSRHLKRRLWRSLSSGLIQTEDSTFLLPLYHSRQSMKLVGNHAEPTDEAQTQAIILSPTDYSGLLNNHSNFNFYQNSVSVLGRSFLSPLSAGSNAYYRYYLADSVQTDEGKQYIVHFRTKNPYYATFNGEMYIDSATFALRSIKADMPQQSSVNFMRHLHINQTLAPDNSLQDESTSLLLDFAVKSDSSHFFPSVLLTSGYTNKNIAAKIPEHHNDTIQTDTLNPEISVSPLDSVPLIRFARWTAEIINTGYIPTGTCIDIGNVQEILQINHHETVHIGLPFRTNAKLMKNVSLEASVGYGFRDRAFKGMGRINVRIPAPRRHVFFLEYHDRYVWTEVDDFTRLMHENGVGFRTMDFTAYAFEALYSNSAAINTATRQRQFQLHFDNDWTDNIETQMYARFGWMGYGNPMVGYHNIPNFRYQTVGGILRVGFQERKIDGYFTRYHVYSHLPVLYFGIEGGSYQTDEMANYGMFAKLNLLIRQHVSLGIGGTLDYALQAGCIFGSVPYPLLHHFEGNQGYAYDPYRFTLMNNFQYAADRFVALHTEWNGQGILFNLIPGVRRLRLRELVTFKMAWGHLPNATDIQLADAQFYHPNSLNTPYVELGCGIGNILRILDIHSVWRLTNWQDTSTPRWGIRFRLHISL